MKVLPEAFSRDPGRMARFQREAEVLASLNHPNVAAIYGVEENALVMELVEGESLPCPLPIDTTLKYAAQIADALEYAHDKGITHRDLKPSNVMVTREGVIKVLDFGLAKLTPEREGGDSSASTVTISPTRAGMIMGTVAYMSPEQARGQVVDRRADIWAFGVVLYELLTGRRAFTGETVSDILAAVLKEEPDLERVPAKARRLVRCCLEKDPTERLQAVGDWRLLLEAGGTEVPRQATRSPAPLWAAIGALVLALAGLSFLYLRETPPEARVVTTTILPPEGAVFDFSNSRNPPATSPDGRRVVFAARTADGNLQLWVRSLNSRTAQPLSTVPKYLIPEEVDRVLGGCDRQTSTGRRDFAILLLLARLGLRAGEVVALQLDDIDWRAGEILVRGKGLLHDRMPLPVDVGEALTVYLRTDRPPCKTRCVFVCMKAPRTGFAGPSTLTTIVRRALDRADLHPAMRGAHVLRHSLATTMLRSGASMTEIGEILRHRTPNTTEIYAKLDFDALRSLAHPWPSVGGGR